MYDVFEDGICCEWGEGSYKLISLGGDSLCLEVNGWVGESETKVFMIT